MAALIYRCPIHGRQEPAEGELMPACPVAIRRTIAGEAVFGTCGQHLETEPEEHEG